MQFNILCRCSSLTVSNLIQSWMRPGKVQSSQWRNQLESGSYWQPMAPMLEISLENRWILFGKFGSEVTIQPPRLAFWPISELGQLGEQWCATELWSPECMAWKVWCFPDSTRQNEGPQRSADWGVSMCFWCFWNVAVATCQLVSVVGETLGADLGLRLAAPCTVESYTHPKIWSITPRAKEVHICV